MKKRKIIKNITTVFYKSKDGFYIAHCLEHSLVAQADRAEDLPQAFAERLAWHIVSSLENKQEPFKHLPPAPKHIVAMAKKASWKTADDAHPVSKDVSDLSLRRKISQRAPAVSYYHSLALA